MVFCYVLTQYYHRIVAMLILCSLFQIWRSTTCTSCWSRKNVSRSILLQLSFTLSIRMLLSSKMKSEWNEIRGSSFGKRAQLCRRETKDLDVLVNHSWSVVLLESRPDLRGQLFSFYSFVFWLRNVMLQSWQPKNWRNQVNNKQSDFHLSCNSLAGMSVSSYCTEWLLLAKCFQYFCIYIIHKPFSGALYIRLNNELAF